MNSSYNAAGGVGAATLGEAECTENSVLLPRKPTRSDGGKGGRDSSSSEGYTKTKINASLVLVAVTLMGVLSTVTLGWHGVRSALATTGGVSLSGLGASAAAPGANPDRYALDPLFQEFRVQPAPVPVSLPPPQGAASGGVAPVLDASFLIVSETNYAFTGLACNWLRSVTRQIGAEAARASVLMFVSGARSPAARATLAECGAVREVLSRDGAATSAATKWGSEAYIASTMRKPTYLKEAFEYASANGFKYMMFNDVDVAWKADLRRTAPRVEVFAAQAVTIGQAQVCSGLLIANVENKEARDIFSEWAAMTSLVLSEGTIQNETPEEGGGGGRGDGGGEETLVYANQTFRGDEDVLNLMVLNSRNAMLNDPARKAATEEKEREAKMRVRRHRFIVLSPELVPNGRYARGADPKYADEDAANPTLVDAHYPDGAHFRALASAIHVNWCVGLKRKVQHLMDYGLWFLNEEETGRLVDDLATAAAADAVAAVGAEEVEGYGSTSDGKERMRRMLASSPLSYEDVVSRGFSSESDPLLALWSAGSSGDSPMFTPLVGDPDETATSAYVGEWAHRPGSGRERFTVCVDNGLEHWDAVYTNNDQLSTLLAAGSCFASVVTEGPGCDEADVRIFSQKAVQWGWEAKTPASKGDKPEGWETWFGNYYRGDGVYTFPAKQRPDEQVYFYFSHEAVGAWSYKDLANPDMVSQMDYLALPGAPSAKSGAAVWWSFGPTVEDLLRSYAWFVIPHSRRVAGLSYLAGDCNAFRENYLATLSSHFPVHAIGNCQHDVEPVLPLPEKANTANALAKDAVQQSLSPYMFHAAMENCDCVGYVTEKVWMALLRGSIPVYKGTKDIYKYLPCPDGDCILDVANFPNAEDLARRLTEIATHEEEWNKMRAWRYNPKAWGPGFLGLVINAQSDLKEGICRVLKGGELGGFPRAEVQSPEGKCAGLNVEVIDRLRTGPGWTPEPVDSFVEPWRISRPTEDDTKWVG